MRQLLDQLDLTLARRHHVLRALRRTRRDGRFVSSPIVVENLKRHHGSQASCVTLYLLSLAFLQSSLAR